MVFNRNCFPKLTDFSRLGALQAVTYTLKVVVSKKWHEIDTLLLHITNRKYHMAYLFVPFPMTLDDLEGHLSNAGKASALAVWPYIYQSGSSERMAQEGN